MDQQIEREGLVNIIKYDEDNAALVWKHPVEDFRMGTQLIVHESQEAGHWMCSGPDAIRWRRSVCRF